MGGDLSRRALILPGLPAAGPPRPVILARETWAEGLPPKAKPQRETPRFLVVHHTADGNGVTSKKKVIALLRSYYRMHTTTKKWPDIAYNFLIDAEGRIWEGRDGSLEGPVRGSATGGSQGFAQLVCLIGDFTKRQPTKAAYASLVALLAWLADRDGIDVARGKSITFTSRGSNKWKKGRKVTTYPIVGHRDMSLTGCPGDAFYPKVRKKLLPDVRARVKKYAARPLAAARPTEPAAVPVRLAGTPGGLVGGTVLAALTWLIARRNQLAPGSAAGGADL